ncbi:MAG TPA: hypothetical protein VKM55_10075 [Candidatus Lokiarchaeia archaeon]|nr:hypothetical protein [Candidatus Lokiarchaeia archaeon]
MHGKIVYTDGHTRAFIAWKRGLESIDAVWDDDDLDETTYETCLEWSESEEIYTIADLKNRIIDDATYQVEWIACCQAIDSNRD